MTTQTTAAPRRKCVMFNLTFSSHYDFAFCTFLCFTLEITVVTIRFYSSRCCFVVGLFADCHLECHARPYPRCSIAAKSHVTGLKILICVEWADFN